MFMWNLFNLHLPCSCTHSCSWFTRSCKYPCSCTYSCSWFTRSCTYYPCSWFIHIPVHFHIVIQKKLSWFIQATVHNHIHVHSHVTVYIPCHCVVSVHLSVHVWMLFHASSICLINKHPRYAEEPWDWAKQTFIFASYQIFKLFVSYTVFHGLLIIIN